MAATGRSVTGIPSRGEAENRKESAERENRGKTDSFLSRVQLRRFRFKGAIDLSRTKELL